VTTPDAHDDCPAADWRSLVDGFADDIWAIARALATNPADALAGWKVTWIRLAEASVDADGRAEQTARSWQIHARETAVEECIRAILARRWNDTNGTDRSMHLS
jgi:hypothetical protein